MTLKHHSFNFLFDFNVAEPPGARRYVTQWSSGSSRLRRSIGNRGVNFLNYSRFVKWKQTAYVWYFKRTCSLDVAMRSCENLAQAWNSETAWQTHQKEIEAWRCSQDCNSDLTSSRAWSLCQWYFLCLLWRVWYCKFFTCKASTNSNNLRGTQCRDNSQKKSTNNAKWDVVGSAEIILKRDPKRILKRNSGPDETDPWSIERPSPPDTSVFIWACWSA